MIPFQYMFWYQVNDKGHNTPKNLGDWIDVKITQAVSK